MLRGIQYISKDEGIRVAMIIPIEHGERTSRIRGPGKRCNLFRELKEHTGILF